MINENYYKIGEFAKITGVSIKSLRYYDSIDVLKPAFTDDETGYRYYLPEQMILLDIIKLCLTFHIPLKSLKHDSIKKSPDLKNLILSGQNQARLKLIETEKLLRLSDDILEQLSRLSSPHQDKNPYRCTFSERKILVCGWNRKTDKSSDYIDKISALHKKAKTAGLNVLTQQGLLMDLSKNEDYIFISFEGEYSGNDFIHFDKSEYVCMILNESELDKIPYLTSENNINPHFVFCMNTDIYDFCLEHKPHIMEIQCV